MATVKISVGGNDVTLGEGSDLGNTDVLNDVRFVYNAIQDLASPLSSLSDGILGSFTLDTGSLSWNLPGQIPGKPTSSPATFSFDASLSATISLRSKGNLFKYYLDFDNAQSVSVDPAPNTVYLLTEIQFKISGDLKASDPIGAIGITADVGGNASYVVRNYKALSPATKCQDAITAGLQGFVLPLRTTTWSRLAAGDYLYYEYDGALNVGFGVTYGNQITVGGYDLESIASGLNVVTQYADISEDSFTVGVSAGVSANFNWSRQFGVFLEKKSPTSLVLHISQIKQSNRQGQFSIDAGIVQMSPPKLSVDSATLTRNLETKLLGTAAGSAAATSLATSLGGEIDKYVQDANSWLSTLFEKGPSGGISLAILVESPTTFTSAFTWAFPDTSNPFFQKAWDDANNGDFLAALATGAVTLDAGSGFEKEHYDSTKATLTLFGLLTAVSLTSYYTQSKFTYAGHGIFHLEFQAGEVSSSSSNNDSTETTVYLDATGDGSPGSGTTFTASGIEVHFHGILDAVDNQSQAERISGLLRLLPGADTNSLGDSVAMVGGQKTSSISIHLVYGMTALKRLQADPYVNGNQSSRLVHPLDAQNWKAYIADSQALAVDPGDPAGYMVVRLPNIPPPSYVTWEQYNGLSNGFTDPSGTTVLKADRHSYSNPNAQVAALQNIYGTNISNEDCIELELYFAAGQQYMNLCDDISSVINWISSNAVVDWGRVVGLVEKASKDADAWYGPSILLALKDSTGCTSARIDTQSIDVSGGKMSATVTLS